MSSDSVKREALMLRIISTSVAAAKRAGQICREVMGSGRLQVVDKGGNDPQTEADRKAQRCIVNTLANRFPGMTIYGEEELEPSKEDQLLALKREECSEEVLRETCPAEFLGLQEKDVVVWVDPLDGTSEFTDGFLNHVTVLIGIAVKGEPVAGVIHRPFCEGSTSSEGQTYWVLKGLGTRGIDVTSHNPPTKTEEMRVVFTRSHYTNLIHRTVEEMKPKEVIRMGGCGHKVMMVVEGEVDAYVFPSPGTKKWDTCVGDAILRQVGGIMTDVNGNQMKYDSWDNYANRLGLVVSMNKDAHQSILDKIPQSVKDELASK